jgi:hypothetical protein
MATGFGTLRTAAALGALGLMHASQNGGCKKAYVEIFDLADADMAKANGDFNLCFEIPEGEAPLSLKVQSTVSLGTSQLKFGTIDNDDLMATSKAYGTTAEAVVEYLLASVKGVPLTERTRVYMGITAANLPSTGKIVVELETSARG